MIFIQVWIRSLKGKVEARRWRRTSGAAKTSGLRRAGRRRGGPFARTPGRRRPRSARRAPSPLPGAPWPGGPWGRGRGCRGACRRPSPRRSPPRTTPIRPPPFPSPSAPFRLWRGGRTGRGTSRRRKCRARWRPPCPRGRAATEYRAAPRPRETPGRYFPPPARAKRDSFKEKETLPAARKAVSPREDPGRRTESDLQKEAVPFHRLSFFGRRVATRTYLAWSGAGWRKRPSRLWRRRTGRRRGRSGSPRWPSCTRARGPAGPCAERASRANAKKQSEKKVSKQGTAIGYQIHRGRKGHKIHFWLMYGFGNSRTS